MKGTRLPATYLAAADELSGTGLPGITESCLHPCLYDPGALRKRHATRAHRDDILEPPKGRQHVAHRELERGENAKAHGLCHVCQGDATHPL